SGAAGKTAWSAILAKSYPFAVFSFNPRFAPACYTLAHSLLKTDSGQRRGPPMCHIRYWVVFSLFFLCACARADDWPQLLGPNRDGISLETGLAKSWPKSGPRVLWRKEVGPGFSGPVVAGKRLIAFYRQGEEEIVRCLDAESGSELWKR